MEASKEDPPIVLRDNLFNIPLKESGADLLRGKKFFQCLSGEDLILDRHEISDLLISELNFGAVHLCLNEKYGGLCLQIQDSIYRPA